MATRALIGIIEGTEIKGIYCHHDGYCAEISEGRDGGRASISYGLGKKLLDHYKTREIVLALIKEGGASIVGITPEGEGIKDILVETGQKTYEELIFNTSFRPNPNYSVFYHREMGRELEIITAEYTGANAVEALNEAYGVSNIEFIYIFENGHWKIYEIENDDETLTITGGMYVSEYIAAKEQEFEALK